MVEMRGNRDRSQQGHLDEDVQDKQDKSRSMILRVGEGLTRINIEPSRRRGTSSGGTLDGVIARVFVPEPSFSFLFLLSASFSSFSSFSSFLSDLGLFGTIWDRIEGPLHAKRRCPTVYFFLYYDPASFVRACYFGHMIHRLYY